MGANIDYDVFIKLPEGCDARVRISTSSAQALNYMRRMGRAFYGTLFGWELKQCKTGLYILRKRNGSYVEMVVVFYADCCDVCVKLPGDHDARVRINACSAKH